MVGKSEGESVDWVLGAGVEVAVVGPGSREQPARLIIRMQQTIRIKNTALDLPIPHTLYRMANVCQCP